MRIVFLDTETTGLSPASGDRIIEVGCIEMVDRALTGRHLHLYVNPQRSSHPDALRVHGLTDEFLSDKPVFAAVAEELLAFVEGAEIVIHNAAFDLGFLDEELRRLERPAFREATAGITDSKRISSDKARVALICQKKLAFIAAHLAQECFTPAHATLSIGAQQATQRRA